MKLQEKWKNIQLKISKVDTLLILSPCCVAGFGLDIWTIAEEKREFWSLIEILHLKSHSNDLTCWRKLQWRVEMRIVSCFHRPVVADRVSTWRRKGQSKSTIVHLMTAIKCHYWFHLNQVCFRYFQYLDEKLNKNHDADLSNSWWNSRCNSLLLVNISRKNQKHEKIFLKNRWSISSKLFREINFTTRIAR